MTSVALGAAREIAGIGRRAVRGLLGGRPGRGAVALVVDADGRLLLSRAVYRRSWTPPGGFLADDEDPVDGALRELREETGLLGTGRLAAVLPRRGHLDHVVIVVEHRGEPSPTSWEIAELAWHRPSDVRVIRSVTARLVAGEGGHLVVEGDRFVLGAAAVPSGP